MPTITISVDGSQASVPVIISKSTKNPIIGICGLTGGNNGSLNLTQASKAMGLTHAARDRVDVGAKISSRVKLAAGANIKSLPIYTNDLSNPSAVLVMAEEAKAIGLTEIEFGNEVYYSNGFNAKGYGAQYRAAHNALKGTGITLIANAYTDGRWCPGVVAGAGIVPDAWSLHPYGGMDEKNMGENEGWQIVPQFISDAKTAGYGAPLHITEVGQPIWTGTDGRKSVTKAEQAADIARYIHDSATWGVASFYYFAMTEYVEPGGEGEGGYGLYNHDLTPRLSAAAFGTAVSSLV